MPKVTCPECDTRFDTASPRYTSCPGCGVRLDVRDPRDPLAVGEPTRSPKTTSPYDTDLAEVKRKKPARRFSGPIVVRKENDDVPKVMIVLIVVGVVGLFSLVVGVGVIAFHAVAGRDPQVAQTNAPATRSEAAPFAPNRGADASVPTKPTPPKPAGGLPGVDPGELPEGPGSNDDDELTRMLPPGFFPGAPARPGRPGGPSGPGGGPGGPQFPGGPGNAPPAAVSIVTLANLRDTNGVGSAELLVDFDYAPGSTPALYDMLILKTGNNVATVRLKLLGQMRGTISVRLSGPRNAGGAVTEAWMERRTVPTGVGQKISNTVTK